MRPGRNELTETIITAFIRDRANGSTLNSLLKFAVPRSMEGQPTRKRQLRATPAAFGDRRPVLSMTLAIYPM
jgi:hypothetical protein